MEKISISIPLELRWEIEVGAGIPEIPGGFEITAKGFFNGTMAEKGWSGETASGHFDPAGYLETKQYIFTAPIPDEEWIMKQVEARFREAFGEAMAENYHGGPYRSTAQKD